MRRILLAAILVVVGISSVGPGQPSSSAPSQQATPEAGCQATTEAENEAIALRWHNEAINAGNLDVIDEIVAPGVVYHAGAFPDGQGLEAIKAVVTALFVGFPDTRHTVEQVATDDDLVVTRWQGEGTHLGEFQGYAPTGKRVTFGGINIFRIECGRIAEQWTEVDGLGRLMQLGVLATPTP
jgi:steroid delta-isomerase-like uncharacterized protein